MTLITMPKAAPPAEKKKPGRKTEAERTKRAFAEQNRERVLARLAEQESKRAPQAQIDQKFTLLLLGILGGVMFVATAILVADGTISSAALSRFADPMMAFVLFGAVEVAVLVFMLLYYIKGSRRDPAAPWWFVAMIGASGVAVGLSVYHVWDLYEFAWADPDMWVGSAIRFVVSLFFVLVSKGLASAIFAKAIDPESL